MKIIDCFPYFNEKELLELRINLLKDYVDGFIICDANKTHSGKEKEFTCKKTIEELDLNNDKIKVLEVELPSYEEEPSPWIRERLQRNSAAQFIEKDDVFIVSDCDEIINPEYIKYYAYTATQNLDNILRVPMVFLNGRADLCVCNDKSQPRWWGAAFFCLQHHIQEYTLSDIREAHSCSDTSIVKYTDIMLTQNGEVEKAGWHFSWMGDHDRIKIKSEAFLHYNEFSLQTDYRSEENSFDCLGRKDHILKKYPIENLPSKIWELERVKNFLLP